jgi:hypothetical protein
MEELEKLIAYVRDIKGIKQIDVFELAAMLPEFEEWMEENKAVWCAAKVKCDLCGNEWYACYHRDSEQLECPNCNQMSFFEVINGKEEQE